MVSFNRQYSHFQEQNHTVMGIFLIMCVLESSNFLIVVKCHLYLKGADKECFMVFVFKSSICS